MSTQQNDRSPDTTALYAWLSRDEDGIEGIIAVPVGQAILPLVMADKERALRLRDTAEATGRARGFPVKLVKFARCEDLT